MREEKSIDATQEQNDEVVILQSRRHTARPLDGLLGCLEAS